MDAERLWITLRVALETHGWTLLLVASLLLVARSQFRAFLQRAHEKRTLAAANEPSRVAALQHETSRIREAQQTRLTSAGATKLKSKSKPKPKPQY